MNAIRLACLSLVLALSASIFAADDRPNILFALADDWSWPHAGVYGDKVIKTPTFDRVAAEGILFSHVFSVSPSCTPSRASILTGQTIHRLLATANLWSHLPPNLTYYTDLLAAAGYHVGSMRKGWGPGDLQGSGRTDNPAGKAYPDFETFLKSVPPGKPFCFWFGSHDPHRAYKKDTGVESGLKPEDVEVPPFLPDTPEVRADICDYYYAVQRYDRETGEMLKLLEQAGTLDNTIVLMTGDNGWPFPRAKANLYDAGTRQPLAVRWPKHVKAGRKSDDYISFQDFAPTFLEAAGLKPAPEMTGRSFLDLLEGESKVARDRVFVERERHANVRAGDLGYPGRAIRTTKYLYIRNLRPDRWPAGDPEMWKAVGPFGDIDDGPSKQVLLKRRDDPAIAKFFRLACGKRPAEELYDVEADPHNLVNLADQPKYAETIRDLRAELDKWMRETSDPRAAQDDDTFDKYEYVTGGNVKPKVEK